MAAFKCNLDTFMPFHDTSFAFTTKQIGNVGGNRAIQAMVFTAPATMTITKAVVYVTANAVGGLSTLRYGLQTVVTNGAGFGPAGIPSGTWVSGTQGTTDVSLFNPNDYAELTGMSFAVTQGEKYAFVMYPDTLWSTGYNFTVNGSITNTPLSTQATWYPVEQSFNGTTTTSTIYSGFPVFGISDGTNWYGLPSPSATLTSAGTGGGSTNQVGFSFQLPSTITSARVSEVIIAGYQYGWASGGVIFRLIDQTTNTTIQSSSSNVMFGTSQSFASYRASFLSPATITPSNIYWVVGEGVGNQSLKYFTAGDTYKTAYRTMLNSVEFGYRNGTTGTFTKVTNPSVGIPIATIVLEDVVTPGGSSGGLLVHPGMAGGIRG
jgi:hypothetical protein